MPDRDNPDNPGIPDELYEYFGHTPPQRPNSSSSPDNVVPFTATRRPTDAYTTAALTAEIAELASCPNGCRNDTLNITALKLARLPINRQQLHDNLIHACHQNGLIRDDGLHSAEATIRSAFTKADLEGPRTIPERKHHQVTETTANNLNGAQAEQTGRRIVWTTADNIADAVPVWAWRYNGKGRIQLGTLALFAGRPGAGKSSAARWFVAQITRGLLEGHWHEHPQQVAYIAAEESAKFTIKPGLRAADADMTRIHFPAVFDNNQNVQLLSIVDETLITNYLLERDIRIVVVDPLMATISGAVDINKNNEIRAQITPWARIADQIEGIVLGVVHMNKQRHGDSVAAINGSSAFGEVARSIFAFAKNPETETRIMSQHKNSTGHEDLSLEYHIESKGVTVATGETTDIGNFVILGDSETTVEDILADAGMSQTGAGAEVRQWLRDYLQIQGSAPSRDVKQAAHKELGASPSSVERAARKLRVLSDSRDFPRRTYWSLPETNQPLGRPGERDDD